MRIIQATLGAALALLVGCGDGSTAEPATDLGMEPDPSNQAGPDAGAISDEAIKVDGVYSVPVDEPALEPYASQPVIVDWRATNGQYRMDYDFPADLTGLSQRVAFEGRLTAAGSIELSGDLGTASCEPSASGSGFRCTERFPQMEFDLERLQRELERRGLSPEEVARRLAVATFFESDPIGILVFTLD